MADRPEAVEGQTRAAPAGEGLVPLSRSLMIDLRWRPGWMLWGATWSFLCGLAASLPLDLQGLDQPIRIALAWLVCVPLWGQAWTSLVAVRGQIPDPETRRAVWAALLWSTLLAWLLDPWLSMLLLGSAGLLVLAGRFDGSRSAWEWMRAAQELALPGLGAWLVAGGAELVAADALNRLGFLAQLRSWATVNWLWPFLLICFVALYHASVSSTASGSDTGRRGLAAGAYGLAALALAVDGRGLGALLLAGLWILQWPLHARMTATALPWHLRATSLPAMIAMLLAAFAASRLGLG